VPQDIVQRITPDDFQQTLYMIIRQTDRHTFYGRFQKNLLLDLYCAKKDNRRQRV